MAPNRHPSGPSALILPQKEAHRHAHSHTPSPHRPPKTDAPAQSPPAAWDLPRLLRLLIPVLALVVIVGIVVNLVGGGDQMSKLARDRTPHWVDKQIIAINGSGRRGEKLSGVTDIAIHYVGNPGTTAQQNHDYYDQPDTTVSSHFLIGLDGEIIQCIPMDEKSSATNDRNLDTLSIEVCHPGRHRPIHPGLLRRLGEAHRLAM